VGIGLLFSFVKYSQDYLSEYRIENSKPFLGQKLDLAAIAEHLGDPGLADFAKNPRNVPLILVFWSSTCIPCLQELPGLQADHPGAFVLPINTDPPELLEEAERNFKLLAPGFAFRHDGEQKLTKGMKITYLPTQVTVDPQGIIKNFHVGKN